VEQDRDPGPHSVVSHLAVAAGVVAVAIALFTRLDVVIFRAIAHLFYEQSALAVLRQPSQLVLAHDLSFVWVTLVIVLAIAGKWLSFHARCWALIFVVAYTIRAVIWIAGSNLPLVPGDSCHYVEIASSILRGEGPVKHYVDSFFRDYPAIRRNEGVLDDWATPLYSCLLAGAYHVLGIRPGESIEATFAVAKGLSFVLNLATLPVLYFFARRRFSAEIALQSMAVLAVLPVHALYAGLELRESLVVLITLLAVGSFVEMTAETRYRMLWAIGSGLFTGLAILSRNTAMATAAACGLYGFATARARILTPLFVWGIVTGMVISPWAYLSYREYGQPFYTYTQYFAYNFSWTVHHFDQGNTTPSQFFTSANLPEILRTKFKSILIVALHSTMIVSVPLVAGYLRRLKNGSNSWDRLTALIALAFLGGTLVGTADVTQVMQLGRYYVPLFVLMIPSAVAGLEEVLTGLRGRRILAAVTLVTALWADPTWAYDFTWLSKTYQLHWPALQHAGEWVRAHPDDVPPDSRIMTWFPWEFRLASRRTTILMNRSLNPTQIQRTIDNYEATHILWGSFEPPADADPEIWGAALGRIRSSLGLNPSNALYRSPVVSPIGTYPLMLFPIANSYVDVEDQQP
jgi:hypothetical protein